MAKEKGRREQKKLFQSAFFFLLSSCGGWQWPEKERDPLNPKWTLFPASDTYLLPFPFRHWLREKGAKNGGDEDVGRGGEVKYLMDFFVDGEISLPSLPSCLSQGFGGRARGHSMLGHTYSPPPLPVYFCRMINIIRGIVGCLGVGQKYRVHLGGCHIQSAPSRYWAFLFSFERQTAIDVRDMCENEQFVGIFGNCPSHSLAGVFCGQLAAMATMTEKPFYVIKRRRATEKKNSKTLVFFGASERSATEAKNNNQVAFSRASGIVFFCIWRGCTFF